MIFGLVRIVIIDGKSISTFARLSAAHALCLQDFLLSKMLSSQLVNSGSTSVIFRPVSSV